MPWQRIKSSSDPYGVIAHRRCISCASLLGPGQVAGWVAEGGLRAYHNEGPPSFCDAGICDLCLSGIARQCQFDPDCDRPIGHTGNCSS